MYTCQVLLPCVCLLVLAWKATGAALPADFEDRLTKAFNAADRSKNGYIDRAEFKYALQLLHRDASEAEIDRFISRGSMTYEGFKNMVLRDEVSMDYLRSLS